MHRLKVFSGRQFRFAKLARFHGPGAAIVALMLTFTPGALAGPARNASDYATSGSGTDGSPWKGWESAFASDTEVVFQKGFYESPVTAISVPGGSVLRGVEGAVLRYPANRSSVNALLSIAAGASNVTIRGLQFEAGVSVPQVGVSSQGGSTFIEIGTVGSSSVCTKLRIEDNRFGVMRYSDSQGGTDIQVLSSVDDFIFTGNRLDAAPSNVMFEGGHSTAQYTYKHILVANNSFVFSQTHHNFGYAVLIGTGGTFTVLARLEAAELSGNIFRSINGTMAVNMPGIGLAINGNEAISDNMDTFATFGSPSGGAFSEFQVVGNTCYGYAPTDSLLVTAPSCLIKGTRVANGVVSGNSLTSPAEAAGIEMSIATNVHVANNLISITSGGSDFYSRCFALQSVSVSSFDHNVCSDSPGEVFRILAASGTIHDLSFVGNEARTTGGSPITAAFFSFENDGGTADRIVLRDNRVVGQNLTGSFRTGSVTNLNEFGNITSAGEGGWRIGSDVLSDLTGDGLEMSSGALQVSSSMTRDTEWNTCAKINTATTDDDFVLASDTSVTRDTEWDTAAEINTRTTDDDFATLTGTQSLSAKDLTATSNVFPQTAAFTFSSSSSISSQSWFGPNTGTKGASADAVSVPMAAMTTKTLYCKLGTAPGASKTWTLTVQTGSGSPTDLLSCAVTGSSSTTCNASGSTVWTAGANLSLRATPTSSPAATTVFCSVGVAPEQSFY